MKNFKITVLWIIASIFAFQAISNLLLLRKESLALAKVNQQFSLPETNIYPELIKFRGWVMESFLYLPHSDLQKELWYDQRSILRQTALDGLSGRVGYCGENARVLINLLRARGIPARRLYLHANESTNHVVLEYFDKASQKWFVLDSLGMPALAEVLAKPVTAEELVADYTHPYRQFFRFNLVKGTGLENFPYFASYLIDDPYLFLTLFWSVLAILFVFVAAWVTNRTGCCQRPVESECESHSKSKYSKVA